MKKSFKTCAGRNSLAVLFALVLVCGALFVFTGCQAPVKQDAVLPEDIVGMSTEKCVEYIKDKSTFAFDVDYTNTDYGTTVNFQITNSGVIKIIGDYDNTEGTLISAFNPAGYDGIMLIVKLDLHSNYGHYQYPNYNEENPHHVCYTAVYIKDISANSVSYACAVWPNPDAPEIYTACASSFSYVKELFVKFGYEGTCAGWATTCTR